MDRHDPASREHYFARRILGGRTILHPGPLTGRMWVLCASDLVDAIVRATSARASQLAVHLAHDDAPSLEGHVRSIADELRRPCPPLRIVSLDEMRCAGLAMYGFPYTALPLRAPSVAHAYEQLGWRPTPYREALSRALAEPGGASKPTPGAWPGRSTRQARLAGTHEWLHEDAERRLLAGTVARAPAASAILAQLAGEPGPPPAVAVVCAERWRDRRDVDDSAQPCLSVPQAMLERLQVAPDATSDARGPLVAALETDREDSTASRGWLFRSEFTAAHVQYGPSAEPSRVLIVAAGEGLAAMPSRGEHVLLEANARGDRDALADYLARCRGRGELHVADIASWSRIYVAGTGRWLATSSDAAWVLTYAVSRLLIRAGVSGPAVLSMGGGATNLTNRPPPVPQTVCLCCAGELDLVVDLTRLRVIQLPRAVARVLRDHRPTTTRRRSVA